MTIQVITAIALWCGQAIDWKTEHAVNECREKMMDCAFFNKIVNVDILQKCFSKPVLKFK
jgi:hypothetical protein